MWNEGTGGCRKRAPEDAERGHRRMQKEGTGGCRKRTPEGVERGNSSERI